MANRIDTLTAASAALDVQLDAVATGAANGEQSSMIDNNTADSTRYRAALLYFELEAGTNPTAGGVYEFYLIRGDDETPAIRDDFAAASAAPLSIVNSHLIDVIVNPSATTGFDVAGSMTTEYLGPLGPEWGVGFVNESGATTSATTANFDAQHVRYLPEIQ